MLVTVDASNAAFPNRFKYPLDFPLAMRLFTIESCAAAENPQYEIFSVNILVGIVGKDANSGQVDALSHPNDDGNDVSHEENWELFETDIDSNVDGRVDGVLVRLLKSLNKDVIPYGNGSGNAVKILWEQSMYDIVSGNAGKDVR